MTQQQLMNDILGLFCDFIVSKRNIIDSYCYNDNRASQCISNFKQAVVNHLGLKLSNAYHAHGKRMVKKALHDRNR